MDNADKRRYHALRAHIDVLLKDGATFVKRDPTLLCHREKLYRVTLGMLVDEFHEVEHLDLAHLPAPPVPLLDEQ